MAHEKMRKFYKFFGLGLSVLFAMTLTGCEPQIITPLLPSPESRSIHVTGSGSVTGEPDLATLYLGVSVEKTSVEEAREEAASAMTAVMDALKSNDIAEKDIQTENFSIYPQYDYTDNGRVLRGYRVTNTLNAKVRELDSLSDVVALAEAAEFAADRARSSTPIGAGELTVTINVTIVYEIE